jgi:hypothetical protein
LRNGLLVFAVLLGIVVASQLIRLLSDAVGGIIAVTGAGVAWFAPNYRRLLSSVCSFHLLPCRAVTATVRWWCGFAPVPG